MRAELYAPDSFQKAESKEKEYGTFDKTAPEKKEVECSSIAFLECFVDRITVGTPLARQRRADSRSDGTRWLLCVERQRKHR
jgi:hypothetical protein